MIVGVSDENDSLLQDYISKKGVEFGIIRAQGGLRLYGGRGYPTFVTIGPAGDVVQYGGVPSKSAIEEHLKEVRLTPKFPDDRAFKSVRRAWEDQDYADVDRELKRGLERNEEGGEIHAAFVELRAKFDAMLASTASRIARIARGPDYYRAKQKLEAIVEQFDGLSPAEAAEKELERFDDDDAIQAEIKAGHIYAGLLEKYDPEKFSDKKKLIKALAAFRQKYPGTYAAEQSVALSTQLAQSR